MAELSILIPARNEMFLARTVQDLLEHNEADTEILIGLDGAWADPVVEDHPRVKIYHVSEAIGQRAMTNQLARLSTAKYVAKVDAHCAFEQGWDRKMIDFFREVGDDVTAVPVMRNLWAFDWKCYHCGWKKYQGPTPPRCGFRLDGDGKEVPDGTGCGKPDKIRRKMMWVGKERPESTSYCFDSEPHFQYYREYTKRPEYAEMRDKFGYTETMSFQGSFFMSTRENYWKWELNDEKLGNWGNQGMEVACATWLNGGRCLVNHKTWYAHMFRTQGGDFGFPWENKGRETDQTKNKVKEKYYNRVVPILEKFWPVNGWTQEDLDKLKANERVV